MAGRLHQPVAKSILALNLDHVKYFMSLRQQNKIRAQSAILEATGKLIAAHGVDDTTTRQIAKEAGVSYQTLYNYFPTKGLILKELLADEVALWGREIDDHIKRYDGDLYHTLDQIHARSVEIVLGERRELWRALSASMLSFALAGSGSRDQAAPEFDVLIGVAHERYHALLSLAQGMGQLQVDADLHLLAHTLFCLGDHTMLVIMLRDGQAESILSTLSEQIKMILSPYYTPQVSQIT